MAAEQSRTDGLVEHEVRVAASPDSVFDYFTDPAKMVEWMGTEATLDPRPGGVCRINPSGQATMLGEFIEVDRPRRGRLHVGLGDSPLQDSTPVDTGGGLADPRRRGHSRAACAQAPEARGRSPASSGLAALPAEARARSLGWRSRPRPLARPRLERRGAARRRGPPVSWVIILFIRDLYKYLLQ